MQIRQGTIKYLNVFIHTKTKEKSKIFINADGLPSRVVSAMREEGASARGRSDSGKLWSVRTACILNSCAEAG